MTNALTFPIPSCMLSPCSADYIVKLFSQTLVLPQLNGSCYSYLFHSECTHSIRYLLACRSDERVFRLASPVISASFLCDNCTTVNFSTPVQVAFRHTPYDVVCGITMHGPCYCMIGAYDLHLAQALIENDRNSSRVMCVFWEFDDYDT